MKGNEHMKKSNIDPVMDKEYYDNITNSGIMLNTKGEMYLIKDGKKMKLNAFVVKESRRECN